MLTFWLLTALAAGDGPSLYRWDPADLADWRMDGAGEVTATDRVVDYACGGPATWWAPCRLEGSYELRFDALTESERCRAILFFQADGSDGRDLFEWSRAGDYGDYAYDETMWLYTMGLLRHGVNTPANLRRLGGPLPERFHILRRSPPTLTPAEKQQYRTAFEAFQPYSIKAEADDRTTLGQWSRYRVRVVGTRLQVWVDDRLLVDYTDEAEPALTRGRFGFRNFGKGSTLRLRDVSVLRVTGPVEE